ncbi:LacI family DNA-binding transcriptional regulator [Cryobacterium sp. AP23]
MTLRDVAESAGVSVSTASRALNSSPMSVVGSASVQRIRQFAIELGYVPNHAARALRGSRGSVVVLADDPTTETTGATMSALEHAARSGGYFVSGIAVGYQTQSQISSVRVARALKPLAIVLSSSRLTASGALPQVVEELERYLAGGGRVISIGPAAVPATRVVTFADREAGQIMARHMVTLGRSRFGILAGPRDHSAFSARVRGFLDVLDEVGVPRRDVTIEYSAHRREDARIAADRLVARHQGIDALLAANDLFAFAALGAIRSAGLSTPGDIAVTGIDDEPLASDISPALTTFAFPFIEVGRRIAELVSEPGDERTHEPVIVHGTLVVRESTSQD